MNFSYSSKPGHVQEDIKDYAIEKLGNVLRSKSGDLIPHADLVFLEDASRFIVKLRTRGKLSLALEAYAYSHYYEAIDELVEKLSANIRKRKSRRVKRKRVPHLKLLETLENIETAEEEIDWVNQSYEEGRRAYVN